MKKLLVVLMALGMSLGVWGEAGASASTRYEHTPGWVKVWSKENLPFAVVHTDTTKPIRVFAGLAEDRSRGVVNIDPKGPQQFYLTFWAVDGEVRARLRVLNGAAEVFVVGDDPSG